ncbi:MAG: bifunctional [glutamine synthetase] adenylyltransferase/[glutamine synthetase]-adenylyl-L-tyrosine phosphorylase [Caulobacteraceae bacterium]
MADPYRRNLEAGHPAGRPLLILARQLKPCGPVVDQGAAARIHQQLKEAAGEGGWLDLLQTAWPALAPVFAASPYLTGLARSRPERLARLLGATPDTAIHATFGDIRTIRDTSGDSGEAAKALRRLKGDIHLLAALCDLGGVWTLETVVEALSDFADLAVQAALAVIAREEAARGRLARTGEEGEGPIPGLFVLAMGKHGGRELNYSSDIDISFFFEPDALPLADGVEPQAFAARTAQSLSRLLADRTPDGYVFRVDLRLRPDPSATPQAVSAAAAIDYYQAVGQNWERAAYIKARPCAGDIPRAQAFLDELRPFVWRRSLDFAAIADVHSIKRQIHVHKTDERLTAPGADLKLGAGGIREIEFFVQTQQLILGGRDPALRSPRTLEALAALTTAGRVAPKTADQLAAAYRTLRGLEHRVQMIADEQTHRLPEDAAGRRRISALAGDADLRRFDARVGKLLQAVNHRYGQLVAGEEQLSSRFGSLVFTGVEDDPETLRTLARLGFSNPSQVSATIRAWHHGRIAATRQERGRELFTRLAPRLLDAIGDSGAPDAAFARFTAFFEGLSAGVQVQSLLLARPELLALLVRVLAFAPRLAATLARRPSALDALLDASFFARFEERRGEEAILSAAAAADGFEETMNAVRRVHREQQFRIGVQILSGSSDLSEAGGAYADLADLCVRVLAPAALAEAERIAGAFPGDVAVIALGKFGGREMTARSDLDLMTLYASSSPDTASLVKGWSADVFYSRFTQRLIAALSAQTTEGGLYDIDMRLRPSGSKGPVAVSFPAFESYYSGEAETWEIMALTRARVVWASSEAFAARARAAIEASLRRPRDLQRIIWDAGEMRALMNVEKPPFGAWDLKLSPGGFVDIEFAAQVSQLVHAADGGPLDAGTRAALQRLEQAGLLEKNTVAMLTEAWRLQRDLAQITSAALDEGADPGAEPAPFQRMLAKAGGAKTYPALMKRLAAAQSAAHAAFLKIVSTEMESSPV